MSRRGLPLAVWAGGLTTTAVLVAVGVAAGVLQLTGGLGADAARALALGASAGLLLSVAAVLASSRVASGLRDLRHAAVQRLQDPSAPLTVPGSRPLAARASSELAELARVLEALHLRVRLGDQLGERHRRDAETAGAGVFELLSGLVAAEEGARGQLAAELHDTVAQSLMLVRSLLAGDAPPDLVAVHDYVEDAEEQVRAVMARTRPPALRDGDLASAISYLRLDMQARYGLEVQVSWPSAPQPLPLASAVTVYRFFQEALLNVVKHADVDEAAIELVLEEEFVRATVRDEGPGFDPDAVRPDRGRHVGLGLLRERARLSGGSLQVQCGESGGTTLVLRLPRPRGAVRPSTPLTATLPAATAVPQVATIPAQTRWLPEAARPSVTADAGR